MVYQAIPQQTPENPNTEVNNDHLSFVNRVYEKMNYSTDSQLTSLSEFEFLSSTEPTEAGLSDREIRKRTDPELMAPIPGPESQLKEVQDLWDPAACSALENILTEFDDLFMKHKADIGRCTIAKHPVEVEPGDMPGARRLSPEKAERANQEVRNLLALGMTQPSLSPWASGIVMVKKKTASYASAVTSAP